MDATRALELLRTGKEETSAFQGLLSGNNWPTGSLAQDDAAETADGIAAKIMNARVRTVDFISILSVDILCYVSITIMAQMAHLSKPCLVDLRLSRPLVGREPER